jgi:hypothetical protein
LDTGNTQHLPSCSQRRDTPLLVGREDNQILNSTKRLGKERLGRRCAYAWECGADREGSNGRQAGVRSWWSGRCVTDRGSAALEALSVVVVVVMVVGTLRLSQQHTLLANWRTGGRVVTSWEGARCRSFAEPLPPGWEGGGWWEGKVRAASVEAASASIHGEDGRASEPQQTALTAQAPATKIATPAVC